MKSRVYSDVQVSFEEKNRLYQCLTYIQLSKSGEGKDLISPAIKCLIPILNFHITNFKTSYTDCSTNVWISKRHLALPAKQLAFIICHEICHVLFLHSIRAANFGIDNDRLWNYATDYFINSALSEYKELEIPFWENDSGKEVSVLLDKKFSHLTIVEELIYKDLIKEKKVSKLKFSEFEHQEHSYWRGADDSSSDLQIEKIKDRIKSMIKHSIKNGTDGFSGGDAIVNRLHMINMSQFNNWDKDLKFVISRFFQRETKYDFQRNQRNNLTKFFLPSLLRKRKIAPKFLVAIDTSGSINDETLALFKGEVIRAIRYGAKIDLVACHSRISSVLLDAKEVDIKLFKPNETGGTDFNPVFKFAIDKTNSKVQAYYDLIIYLTDGLGVLNPSNYKNYSNKTLWLINNKSGLSIVSEWKFGKIISIK